MPDSIYRAKLKRVLSSTDKYDMPYILDRVNYYNKLSENVDITSSAKCIEDLTHKNGYRIYYFDTVEFTRYFDPKLYINHDFGDVTYIPTAPSIVKSRPINGDNKNSVVLKLEKVRHFHFVKDRIKFNNKKDLLVWRGCTHDIQVSRQVFLSRHFNNPLCDAGHVNDYKDNKWKIGLMSIKDQLKFKFILSIEGNDVATNLKWIMNSNSLCFACKSVYETWFMEGRLIPNFHYVEIKSDYSDLDEKIAYYSEHTDEALEIIRNAHEYVKQFRNKKRERLISLMVLDKYFQKTNKSY